MVRWSHTSHVRTDNPISTRRLFFSLIVAIVIGLLLRPSLANAHPLLGTVTGPADVTASPTGSKATLDRLILTGGTYNLGTGTYLYEDNPLSVEAMTVAMRFATRSFDGTWHRTFEDEGNGYSFIGAYNVNTGASVGIEVGYVKGHKHLRTVLPLTYSPNG